MRLTCTDPRCRGCCTVATVEGGFLVIVAKHHGEKHTSRIPLTVLVERAAVV